MDEVEELVNFGITRGGQVQPAQLVRVVSEEENLGDIIRQIYQGQMGVLVPGEAVEYALVRLRNDIDFDHPNFEKALKEKFNFDALSFIENQGQIVIVRSGPTGIDLLLPESIRVSLPSDDSGYIIDRLYLHTHPSTYHAGIDYAKPSDEDILTLRRLGQQVSYIVAGREGMEVYRFYFYDEFGDLDDYALQELINKTSVEELVSRITLEIGDEGTVHIDMDLNSLLDSLLKGRGD
jgi:hypothetical protein